MSEVVIRDWWLIFYNGTSVAIVLTCLALVHLNRVGKEPYATIISLCYAGLGLSIIAMLLAKNIPFFALHLPMLGVIRNIFLCASLSMVSIRLVNLYGYRL